MEGLREAAEGLLAWKDDVRECNRRGISLARMVLDAVPKAEAPEEVPKSKKKAKSSSRKSK